ncbi:MAG: response regulator transcription factor [Balneolales bacterium]|nr:response regulator transcription factor [Balneolales bacterium]
MNNNPPPFDSGKMLDVWIIEDNRSYRDALSILIGSMDGFSVPATFVDVESALSELKSGPRPGVIMCDIDLPGMSGIEGVSEIKKSAPEVYVIMLTVHDEEEYVFRAICGGADGYLLKSTSETELGNSVAEILNGGAPMNPRIAMKVLKMFSRFAPSTADYDLSEREKEVLNLLIKGCTKKQVAAQLYLSFHTVDFHLRNIYKKLQVNSRSEAVAKALKEGII